MSHDCFQGRKKALFLSKMTDKHPHTAVNFTLLCIPSCYMRQLSNIAALFTLYIPRGGMFSPKNTKNTRVVPKLQGTGTSPDRLPADPRHADGSSPQEFRGNSDCRGIYSLLKCFFYCPPFALLQRSGTTWPKHSGEGKNWETRGLLPRC
jgi:hypothetical protein